MPPVVSVIGKKNCGKTTLIEKLIPELKSKGLRVGTIKHHVHEFEMDIPGKDTWRHKKAGAHTVALSSPENVGIISSTDGDISPEELLWRYFSNMDFVIMEGYKKSSMPKIEIYRSSLHPTPLDTDHTLIATVSDVTLEKNVPGFALDDISSLADYLIHKLKITQRKNSAEKSLPDSNVSVLVRGEKVTLSTSQQNHIDLLIHSMISTSFPDNTDVKGAEYYRETKKENE